MKLFCSIVNIYDNFLMETKSYILGLDVEYELSENRIREILLRDPKIKGISFSESGTKSYISTIETDDIEIDVIAIIEILEAEVIDGLEEMYVYSKIISDELHPFAATINLESKKLEASEMDGFLIEYRKVNLFL